MHKLFLYLRTAIRLGLQNVFYVAWYRFSLRTGIRKHFFPPRELKFSKDFFKPGSLKTDYPDSWKDQLVADADRTVSGETRYYSRHWKQTGTPPDWFLNPFSGTRWPDPSAHWTKVSEFNPLAGDIKNTWEASRFDWAVLLARAFSVTGDFKYTDTFNGWISDWTLKNPLNTGLNWRCGQEASIRVFNLALASVILEPSESAFDLINAHLERISGNIRYAIAQDNNHGTSEAAGLFIGGSLLTSIDSDRYPVAKDYAAEGRRWLEKTVRKLVAEDGSFSQHSANYHRVLLDTLTLAEFFRNKTGQEPFSRIFYERAKAALNWLYQVTNELSGETPNLGANDGSSLLNSLHGVSYCDFRPSLQLASVVFSGRRMFGEGPWDEPLMWLGLMNNNEEVSAPPRESAVFRSGYVVMHGETSWALVRFPYFRFRPSHNDVFHFDLWNKGHNILCDAGTFSYNPQPQSRVPDLRSVHNHNTVSFDGREQMPLLSRFLLGNWLTADETGIIEHGSNGCKSWKGSYTDSNGNSHSRKISVQDTNWTVEDKLEGRFKKAEIGFNIDDPDCVLQEGKLKGSFGCIDLPENAQASLGETFVSAYYNETRTVQRLIIEVSEPGVYVTSIHPDR